MFLITPIVFGIQFVGVVIWDFGLMLVNLVAPRLKPEHVTPEGHAGVGGTWPKYIAPKDGDSRCACPALNAMANHGL